MITRRQMIGSGLAAISAPFICKGYSIKSMFGADGIENIQEEQGDITAESYIQDGLLAQWDGIENAGYGVHDDTISSWKDLVGDSNLQLLGACTFHDSYCTISGMNNEGCAYFNNPLSIASGYGWTFHFVFRLLDQTSYVCRPYSCRGALNLYEGIERYNQNGTLNGLFTGVGTSYIEWHGLFSTSLNTIICEHYVISETGNLMIYVNGHIVATSTCKVPTSIPNVLLGNSMTPNGNRGCNEDVFHFGIYNRALSNTEIAYNAMIDKARFGQ